jgi:hypothetical protein
VRHLGDPLVGRVQPAVTAAKRMAGCAALHPPYEFIVGLDENVS